MEDSLKSGPDSSGHLPFTFPASAHLPGLSPPVTIIFSSLCAVPNGTYPISYDSPKQPQNQGHMSHRRLVKVWE